MSRTKSSTKKFVVGLLGATLAVTLVFAGVSSVKADTVSDLTAQINALQAQLSQISSGSSMSTSGYSFARSLSVGSTGSDVMNLQKVLNMSADTQVAKTGAGSPGYETSKFGPATKAAVIKFQKKYGISATGYVGPITRGQLSAVSGPVAGTSTTSTSSTPVVVAPAGTGLTVTAPAQPAVSLAPKGSSRVPFTKVTLTAGNDGDVTVNSLTVQRTGLAQDAAFAGVALLDEDGIQLGIAKSFNSNHQVSIGDPFVVKRGTSRTLTIAGNMASSLTSYTGQVASLSVVQVNTSATVSGSLPIVGTGQTLNDTLTIGTVTMNTSSFDPNSASTQSVGTTAFKFAGVRVTAGSAEDLRLWSIRWNQSGSASSGDLANVMVYVDGTAYPTTVSSDGKYYTAKFGNGIVIAKGFSKDIYVQGDVVGSGAAGRTIQFDIYKTTDLYLTGETYMYGIAPAAGSGSSTTASTFTGGTPWFDASLITVSAGTVTTINKSAAVPAANVAINVPNQVLGGYETDIKGEPISVQTTVFHFTDSSVPTSYLTQVSLVDNNGAVVAGPVDAQVDSSAHQKVTFTDTITYPIGKKVYKLVGKIPSSGGYSNNTTIIASTTPSSDWSTVTGQTTGNTIASANLPASAVNMNTMTVRAATLSIGVSSNPSSQTIVAGGTEKLLANYQFDATQSGEDVRFASLALHNGGSNTATNITGCKLYDGATILTTGSNVINPTVAHAGDETFTLDSSLTIPKGTVKTLALKCNLAAASTGTVIWGITAAQIAAISATGVTSSNTVTPSGATAAGATMTIGSSSLTVSNGASTPSYTVTSAGVTGTIAGSIKFRSTNEAVNLTKIALKLTNAASSSATDLVQVSLWDGNTQIGTATFTGSSAVATSTLSSTVALPKDTDKEITIKVDLADIGSSGPVLVSGHLIAIDVNNNDTTGTQGTGVESGVTINATGSTSFAGIRVFKSYPTLAIDPPPNFASGVADGRLLRFKVTASASGAIGLQKFTLSIATTSATVSSVNIFGYTDSAYSQAIPGVNTSGQLMASNQTPNNGGAAVTPFVEIYAQTNAAVATTIQVPAGQTRYFEARGTVAGTATTYSVTTTLGGDTAYPANIQPNFMASSTSSTGIDLDTNDNFIWSPNSTSTAVTTDADWTNGFALPGLPSNGIIQTRSN